ncbi:MAG: LPS export ABC transporter periplasmic protein LptC [bacterium]|nr:LPS export ABC transporter periplasmic protein LptC [bacterium]
MLYRLLTSLLLLAALFVGCSEQNASKDSSPSTVDSANLPDSEVSGATIYLFHRGELTTEIRADRILKFEAADSTMGYQLDIDFLDSASQIMSNLVSDSGVIRETTNHLQAYGHVVVITHDSLKLETDFLTWNPEIDKIQTDAFVKFTKEGNVFTGWGMEANRDLSRLRILNQISSNAIDLEKLSEPE